MLRKRLPYFNPVKNESRVGIRCSLYEIYLPPLGVFLLLFPVPVFGMTLSLCSIGFQSRRNRDPKMNSQHYESWQIQLQTDH